MNMNKLLVTIVVSTFALGSAESFAAGTLKLEDLTREQRMDMRSRADQLTADRAASGGQMNTTMEHTMKVKKSRTTKTRNPRS